MPLRPATPHEALAVCRTERQYRDLAYCVSQLALTERGLRKMLDNFDCFGDKLSDESVFSAFLSVVGKLRRGAKPEGKVSLLPQTALQPRHQHHLRPALSVSNSCFFVSFSLF